ncbi:uncharacterized protein PHACADRAFT_181981 [Phanerochaete carnosa HHB-10118-sp]|uniref:Uncharacterized protein n=1 Tax=Phanerochaete carnosa (strain HHB-10118-sp) TaxID=650164 RepID=K5WLS3_PHACS|nr:uncharacterized protein PHACADRAFT_181981 [Phanerochaete carnosa HHB-10118-sp]EKM60139.1 hypothetical protein PHACADRAFT_181981 [Phanerochaete carnosa HHB-10118-sp]
MSSNLSTLALASDATVVSQYTPDEYERTSYYNGITGDGDHPELVYRSDFPTTPSPKPVGRHAHLPVKSLRGIFDTPLNSVWDTVAPEIHDLIKARKINWLFVDPAHFFTHGLPGEEHKESLGPVVIWVSVIPGSTSSDTTHEVSREILTLLLKNRVKDAIVEWREAVLQRLTGPPLMHHVSSNNAIHYVCRIFTALLRIPFATEGMEEEDVQGTLTLWFHENKDKDGNPSDKVYKAKERQDADNAKGIRANRRNLEDVNEAIADLKAFYNKVMKHWSEINLHCNIGHVQYAASITIDIEGGTLYTSDWAAFLAAEAKVKDEFKRSKYSPQELTAMFYHLGGGATTFKFSEERKLRIEGYATKEDLTNPTEFDSKGQRCLIVGKNGNTTDLTIGRYAGLMSFTLNKVGIESVELSIYNSGVKGVEAFSAKEDLGSFVWHMTNSKACIVGQLQSGNNKGGSTSNHVTYCTPGWPSISAFVNIFSEL